MERKSVPVGARRDNGAWEQRRTSIVDTAAHLFATKGFHATGVADLGDAVGLGRGALYYYIESKENLLTLIHDRVMEVVLAAGEMALHEPGTATERLQHLGHELIRIIVSFPDHVWVFLHEFRSLTGEPAEEFRRKRRVFEVAVETILQDGIDAGEFQVDSVHLVALGWLGLHNYIYIWYHEHGSSNADEIADQFAKIFMYGIHTGRGTKDGD
jgi:TetR/AcrR family transcriptional regulator, cholesterol catabolism regulator